MKIFSFFMAVLMLLSALPGAIGLGEPMTKIEFIEKAITDCLMSEVEIEELTFNPLDFLDYGADAIKYAEIMEKAAAWGIIDETCVLTDLDAPVTAGFIFEIVGKVLSVGLYDNSNAYAIDIMALFA